MPRISLDFPPGINSNDTAFAAAPAWAEIDKMRFVFGRPQVIGGWESVIADLLTGVCRSVFNWTDNDNVLMIAAGTHSALQLWRGGELFDITPSSGFTAGQIDGTGSAGFGTGAYGIGGYGEPSATDYFPLTWSHGAWGQKLLSSPRDQTLFEWSNNTAVVAAAIANAPDNITYMLVSPQFQVFALGCNEESGGAFNPMCIRHSAVRNNTSWTSGFGSNETSREYVLQGGGRIVAGRVCGKSVLVWTNWGLYVGTYVGSINQIWRFDLVARNCGLIGPNAAVVKGSTAFWVSPDRQFYSYSLGGAVLPIPCPVRDDFADNLAASQGDKIVASTVSEFSEVRFDYPDARDGYENSRYLSLLIDGPDVGSWAGGIMARTAMTDAGPASFPIGTTYEGNLFWHEKGQSADGAAFDWRIKSADTYLSEDVSMLVRGFWPDIADQVGPAMLKLYGRQFPQGDVTTYGPYTMTPGQDRVDFKASGRLFAVEIYGESTPTYARIGRLPFDVKPRGRR